MQIKLSRLKSQSLSAVFAAQTFPHILYVSARKLKMMIFCSHTAPALFTWESVTFVWKQQCECCQACRNTTGAWWQFNSHISYLTISQPSRPGRWYLTVSSRGKIKGTGALVEDIVTLMGFLISCFNTDYPGRTPVRQHWTLMWWTEYCF